MTHTKFLAAVVVLSSVALLGCSKKNSSSAARVSGSLTYNGQPIKGGVMYFHDSEGKAYAAKISPDGTYSASDIPVGELIVTVDTDPLNPGRANAPKGPTAEARMKMDQSMSRRPDAPSGGTPPPSPADLYIKIPAKYANAKTSPLTVTLDSGRNVKDINLTD